MQGQRKTVLGMPAAESVCHSGTPFRRFTTRGWASIFFGPLEPGQRHIGQISFRIAADEIKNSVTARICPGRQRRTKRQESVRDKSFSGEYSCRWRGFWRGSGSSPRSSIASTMPGSSPSRPMTITFLRKKRTRNYGVSLGLSLGASTAAGVCGEAEFPCNFEKDADYLVPEDQQEAEQAGQARGHRHHLVGTSIQRQQFNSHEYSSDSGLGLKRSPRDDLNIADISSPVAGWLRNRKT